MNEIETINDDIKLHEMYAHYWMTMANTGVGKNRILSHGLEGPLFTDDEKIADCVSTANRHIELMSQLIDHKKTLLAENGYLDRPLRHKEG